MKRGFVIIGQESFDENELAFLKRLCETIKTSDEEVKVLFAKVTKKDTAAFEKLLDFRFDPDSYKVPCCIWGDGIAPFLSFLWPRSPRDKISLKWDSVLCQKWIDYVLEKSFKVPSFDRSHEGRLSEISAFELLMTMGLGNVSGVLNVVRSDGANAKFRIRKGCVIEARSRGIEGIDALYDFVSWCDGVYIWEVSLSDGLIGVTEYSQPVPILQVLEDYRKLLNENIHIFEIIDSLETVIELKPSHCALDDPADPFFSHYARICNILSKQNVSIDALLQISTMSPIRTLFFVNRIISLGDAVPISSGGDEVPRTYIASIDGIPDDVPSKPYRTLIVDDAPFFLKVLKRIVDKDSRFDVVATAKDGIECLELLDEKDPDIITLDLEMPRLDGLSTLKRIMIQNPKPVVVLSAFTGESSKMTYDAFKFGAVDVIEKPKNFSVQDMEQNTKNILDRLVRAARIQLEEVRYVRTSREGAIKTAEDVSVAKYVQPHDRVFVNVFGPGSFSHFLKVLFMLDSIDLDIGMIFYLPVRFEALKELAAYIQADCNKYVKFIDENPTTLIKDYRYICPQDRLITAFATSDGVALTTSDREPSQEGKNILWTFLDSVWSIFGSNVVLSGISGNEEDADVFEHCARRGIPVFYLSPEKCLYAGLSIKLRENGIGTEVKGLDSLIEMWKEMINT